MKNYRFRKKKDQKQKTSDIQAELTLYNNRTLNYYAANVLNDIQVELNYKINNRISQLKTTYENNFLL